MKIKKHTGFSCTLQHQWNRITVVGGANEIRENTLNVAYLGKIRNLLKCNGEIKNSSW